LLEPGRKYEEGFENSMKFKAEEKQKNLKLMEGYHEEFYQGIGNVKKCIHNLKID